MDKQREMFEAWQVDSGRTDPMYLVYSAKDNRYALNNVQSDWDTWQAAIAAQWQPIETAPKDSTVVDLWSAMHGRLPSYYRTDLGNGNVFYEPAESGYSVVRDATHWMPLPPEPTN